MEEKGQSYGPDDGQVKEDICTVEVMAPDSVNYDGKTIPYEEYLRMIEGRKFDH